MLKFFIIACVVLFISACRKEETVNRLRIKKVAYSSDFTNPLFSFEYSPDGKLVKVVSGESPSSVTTISYNNDLPVSITRTDYFMGEVSDIRTRNVTWTLEGFMISNNVNQDKSVYVSDSLGHILKRTYMIADQLGNVDTSLITIDWSADSMTISETSEKFLFNRINSPFKDINPAIRIVSGINYGRWINDFQQLYCVDNYVSLFLTADATYKVNDLNYPVVANIFYTIMYSEVRDDVYFEYEKY